MPFSVLKKHLKILLANYNPENSANNHIYYKMESLNKRGLEKLYEIHKETKIKIQNLMEQEKYKGSMPFFSAGFFDMFFLREPANKTEERNEFI